jgi:hypothetical protein
MKGEGNDWCCSGGKSVVPPLPPLPANMAVMLQNHELSKDISALSRRLNNLFSFTAIGATGGFTQFATGPPSVSITGRTYHRLYDVADARHSLHWYLYDELERDQRAQQLNVPWHWIQAVKMDLERVNPYIDHLHQFNAVDDLQPHAIELTDVSTNGDFAAIMHASNTTDVHPRGILIWNRSFAEPTFMPIFSRHYEPMQYPVLFPHGNPGWGLNDRQRLLPFTQRVWCRGRLLTDDRFQTFGRLGCEYLCDMYSRVEEERLKYIRRGLATVAQHESNSDDEEQEVDVELPASFLGSRKWASEQTADSLALARTYGKPSLFITMTCNPKWPEIHARLSSQQNASDIPVVGVRAFKLRHQELGRLLRTKFGELVYEVKVIEFQKRGWPHAHIVCKVCPSLISVCLRFPSDLHLLIHVQVHPELPVDRIDDVIKAEVPRDNPALAAKIRTFMTHARDHLTRENSRCRKGNSCIYGFPHPITPETWIDDDGRVHYRRRTEDDRWIVPHIPELVDKLDCHIHVDIVFTSAAFSYLYKYLHKGPDWTKFQLDHSERHHVDEIDDYVKGRYLSSHESAWRMLGFDITTKKPSVKCLPVHLPGGNIPRYTGGEKASTLLIRYFHRPDGPEFDALSYVAYFETFTLCKWTPTQSLRDDERLERPIRHCVQNKVRPRTRTVKVSRLQTVPPSTGELFYLRCLLNYRPARTFDDLKTVDMIQYGSFHDAATHLGLFTNENEGFYAMTDAVASYHTPAQLRFLFSRILLEGYPAQHLWDSFAQHLADDFVRSTRNEDQGQNLALHAINNLVRESGRRLSDFGLPEPAVQSAEVFQELQTYAPRAATLLANALQMCQTMNPDQRHVFDCITRDVNSHTSNPATAIRPRFVEGRPGRGKTYILNAVASQVRGKNQIALIAGTSALAATLYEGGRTAHNLFRIPVKEVRVFHHHTWRMWHSHNLRTTKTSIPPFKPALNERTSYATLL